MGSRIVINAIGEPGDYGEHAEPAELAGEVADFLVLEKDAPFGEEDGPIAFIGIDNRADEGAGVGHVGADIKKVFEEPEEGEGQAIGLALEEEKGGTEKRDDEFTQSAAHNHEGVTAPAECGMTDFVDGEIGVVEEEEAGIVTPSVEQEEEIEREDDATADAGNAGPVVGAIERKVHERSVPGAKSKRGEIESLIV